VQIQKKIVFFRFNVSLYSLRNVFVKSLQFGDVDEFIERFIRGINYLRINGICAAFAKSLLPETISTSNISLVYSSTAALIFRRFPNSLSRIKNRYESRRE
jgi:hypothetical protein